MSGPLCKYLLEITFVAIQIVQRKYLSASYLLEGLSEGSRSNTPYFACIIAIIWYWTWIFIFHMIWEIGETWTRVGHALIDSRKVFHIPQNSRFFNVVNSPRNTFPSNMVPGFRLRTRIIIAVFARAAKKCRLFLLGLTILLFPDTDLMYSSLLRSFRYASAAYHKATGFLRRSSIIKDQNEFSLLTTSRTHSSLFPCAGPFVHGK